MLNPKKYTKSQIKEMAKKLNLSKVSKLNCYSWSLQAWETCPGAKDSQVCMGCYARNGCYVFPSVKRVRKQNKEMWRAPEWEGNMIDFMKTQEKFRWFDSGDAYSLNLLNKMYRIMKEADNCLFWLPTRMYKFSGSRKVLEQMKELPNVAVRYSSDNIDTFEEIHGSVVVLDIENMKDKVFICPSYLNEGKCLNCLSCWDPKIKRIGYKVHGNLMKRVIKTL